MSTDLFLKIDGITGESQDSNHKGCISIESFTWGANQPGNMTVGGGGGAGKVQYRDLIGVSYQFQASKVKTQYWEQSVSDGKGAETQSGWDIKGNKEQ